MRFLFGTLRKYDYKFPKGKINFLFETNQIFIYFEKSIPRNFVFDPSNISLFSNTWEKDTSSTKYFFDFFKKTKR